MRQRCFATAPPRSLGQCGHSRSRPRRSNHPSSGPVTVSSLLCSALHRAPSFSKVTVDESHSGELTVERGPVHCESDGKATEGGSGRATAARNSSDSSVAECRAWKALMA